MKSDFTPNKWLTVNIFPLCHQKKNFIIKFFATNGE